MRGAGSVVKQLTPVPQARTKLNWLANPFPTPRNREALQDYGHGVSNNSADNTRLAGISPERLAARVFPRHLTKIALQFVCAPCSLQLSTCLRMRSITSPPS